MELAREERDAALRDTRRRIILDGAWKVFAAQGLDGATMRAIATASGCTTGAIYPIFPSKEAIYGALLGRSLDRLHAAVASAVETQRKPAHTLKAGALAFIAYYAAHPDEVVLGLYLWNGMAPSGLTPELDVDLNQRLADTLDLFGESIREMLGTANTARARTETAALFAFLIGALVTHHTGRLRTLGSDIEKIARLHITALIERLESSAS